MSRPNVNAYDARNGGQFHFNERSSNSFAEITGSNIVFGNQNNVAHQNQNQNHQYQPPPHQQAQQQRLPTVGELHLVIQQLQSMVIAGTQQQQLQQQQLNQLEHQQTLHQQQQLKLWQELQAANDEIAEQSKWINVYVQAHEEKRRLQNEGDIGILECWECCFCQRLATAVTYFNVAPNNLTT